jgi:hypothetical protein
VVVEAEVKKEPGRPLFGVNGEVRSKKDLTGPTLLEISDYHVNLRFEHSPKPSLCPSCILYSWGMLRLAINGEVL